MQKEHDEKEQRRQDAAPAGPAGVSPSSVKLENQSEAGPGIAGSSSSNMAINGSSCVTVEEFMHQFMERNQG